MATKKRKKENSKLKYIKLFVMFCLSVFFIFYFISEFKETSKIQKSINVAYKEQKELVQKKENLNIEKQKLEDPQYILRLARGKYLATKGDGEQVFKLPDDKEDKE